MSANNNKIYNPFLNFVDTRKVIFQNATTSSEAPVSSSNDGPGSLDGLRSQALRLRANGGYDQQERMVYDKRRSLDRSLLYSYQSATIKKVQCTDGKDNSGFTNIHALDEHITCKALINPDKLKQDYDDKILSVHLEENFHEGDIIEWVGTNTHWLIYLQDYTETAYFRAEIRRCQYEISWEDEDGEHTTYAAVRGPVETKINYIQKHLISVDTPNYSLHLLLPRDESTLKYFQRYAKFYLKGQDEGSPQICWRIEATDWISTPGILEIDAVEYYANETEDDIENGIVGGLIVEEENPNNTTTETMITGDTFIKPKQVYEYHYTGLPTSSWSIKDSKAPVEFNVNPNDARHIKLKWTSMYSGEFVLVYGSYEKTIVVETLF